jgi:uncharacterized protein (TIGR02453 family)
MDAVTAARARFGGFPRRGFELLRELAEHNNRAWFAANRPAFEITLVRPALALVSDLGPLLRRRVSPGLRAEPRVGGSILRLQHDARYTRDGPFRTHLELWFWEGPGASRDHPGYFLRLTPDHLVVGAGITMFPADRLLRYRAAVDEPGSGRELAAILHRLGRAGWSLQGGALRRVPGPYGPDHERGPLLRLIGLRVERAEPLPEAVFGPQLPHLLVTEFVRLRPLQRWLGNLESAAA